LQKHAYGLKASQLKVLRPTARYSQNKVYYQMPFELLWEPKGLYRRSYGTLTAADALAFRYAVSGDPRLDALKYVIIDCIDAVAGDDLTQAMMGQLAAFNRGIAATNPRIRAAVVSTDETIKSLIDMYRETGLGTYPIRQCSTVMEARQWIDSTR
jgi:hypothetical protein